MTKFVVVDDSMFIAEKIKAHFESSGHEVLGLARDGVMALEMYKSLKPDLVTLDITMPNMDGQDCLVQILDFDSEAKVVIISALEDKKTIVSCLNAGAKGFIAKPLLFKKADFCEQFNSAISDALN